MKLIRRVSDARTLSMFHFVGSNCCQGSEGSDHRENDVETALRLSREEEANRNRALEDANQRALFDDSNQL